MPMSDAPIDRDEVLAQFARMSEKTVFTPLGIRLRDYGDDFLELEMPITDAARQPMGLLHGGVSMVLAESAASMHSTLLCDLTREAPVGIEINGSHVRSADSGHVLARATVVRRTRTLVVHEIRITHVETGNLLCVSRVTNLFKPHR
jgi:uncharacterized protein (TIGR00369 family)